MSGRTTLKTYFLTGAAPTEANFSDLIDSVFVLSEDLTENLSSTSTSTALTASAGKVLNDSISAIDARIVTLESAESDFATEYYKKTEIDTQITSLYGQITSLPYDGQLTALSSRVTALESLSYAPTSHTHAISDVVGLQAELDTKASITLVQQYIASVNSTISALETGDESTEVASLQTQVDAIVSSISALPTSTDLALKSNSGHTHTISDITDLTANYYNKTQTDALLSNVQPGSHTHTESEITDLDKYTQGAVDLKLTDHNNLTNNPHNVTKAQVSLGNVENLSVVDLFSTPQAQAFATDAELRTVSLASSAHISTTNNPHNVTKAQVSLGNVPNVNFQSLLDSHINASNPHNINLSFFDVYSRAETDTRVQHYIDTLRYAYTPTSATDSSGSVGDLAYDSSNLYFKTSATNWLTLSGGGSSGGAITGSSLNIGSGLFGVTSGMSPSTDINTPNLSIADNLVLLNKNQTGTPSNALEGGLEIERGSFQNAKVYWQESTSKWKCNLGGQVKTISFEEDAPYYDSQASFNAKEFSATSSVGVPGFTSGSMNYFDQYTSTDGDVLDLTASSVTYTPNGGSAVEVWTNKNGANLSVPLLFKKGYKGFNDASNNAPPKDSNLFFTSLYLTYETYQDTGTLSYGGIMKLDSSGSPSWFGSSGITVSQMSAFPGRYKFVLTQSYQSESQYSVFTSVTGANKLFANVLSQSSNQFLLHVYEDSTSQTPWQTYAQVNVMIHEFYR